MRTSSNSMSAADLFAFMEDRFGPELWDDYTLKTNKAYDKDTVLIHDSSGQDVLFDLSNKLFFDNKVKDLGWPGLRRATSRACFPPKGLLTEEEKKRYGKLDPLRKERDIKKCLDAIRDRFNSLKEYCKGKEVEAPILQPDGEFDVRIDGVSAREVILPCLQKQ